MRSRSRLCRGLPPTAGLERPDRARKGGKCIRDAQCGFRRAEERDLPFRWSRVRGANTALRLALAFLALHSPPISGKAAEALKNLIRAETLNE